MSNLAAPGPRAFELRADANEYQYPQGSEQTWEGSALGDNSGVARTLHAGDNFLGFARQSNNNAAAVAGTVINTKVRGGVVLSVTGVTNTSTGATVYASDGNTFTTTSTSNSPVGVVKQVLSGGLGPVCLVEFAGVGTKAG